MFRISFLFALSVAVLLLMVDDAKAWGRRCRGGSCQAAPGVHYTAPAVPAGCGGFYAPAPAVTGPCYGGACVPQSFQPFVPASVPMVMPAFGGCQGGSCAVRR